MHLTRAEHKAAAQAYKQAINPGLILLSAEPASHSAPVCGQSYHINATLKLSSNSLIFFNKKKRKERNMKKQSYPFCPSRLNSWVLNSGVRKNPHHDLDCCFKRRSVIAHNWLIGALCLLAGD